MKNTFFCDQLDGRPMSGDIGRGATRETVSFAVHMASVSEIGRASCRERVCLGV